ncbi:MAG TPA: hypothetical protein DCP31_09970 [Cyanobacteria bacterium UBA8543]|nr:hypothetical protein [Cyanobacteria bacterium UBA8543]
MHAGKRCTEQAKLAYEAFSAIGIRVWMQQIKGYQKEVILPQKTKLPDGLLKLVARIEKNGERLHTLHHQLMTDVRDLVVIVCTTYNQSAREEYFELLTRLNQQLEKAIAVGDAPKLIEQAFIMTSTQTGCLERYTNRKKNKAGVVVEYPKINATTRDKSIDEDWWWRYKYSVKNSETGKWVARSTSVSLGKLGAVRTAIALDASASTILRLIEE